MSDLALPAPSLRLDLTLNCVFGAADGTRSQPAVAGRKQVHFLLFDGGAGPATTA